jgi:starch-binding outer membrane protein, SusD/RagB family
MKSGRIVILLTIVTLVLSLIAGCGKDFLDVRPVGVLSDDVFATEEGIDDLLVGCYACLDGRSGIWGWGSAASNWLYGDVRGLTANKGSDAGDSSPIPPIQTFSENPTNGYLEAKWRSVYDAIQCCNSAVRVTNLALKKGKITQAKADLFLQQARVLRGWYHFDAWRMWQKIPYVDENADGIKVSNTTDVRDKIIEDLRQGTLLPDNMGAVGRFNGTVSRVILAKALMQMYRNYREALPLLEEAKNGTKPDGSPIGLAPTYGEIFDIVNRNGIEAIYTVQYSVNDGSGGINGGYGEVLNFPYRPHGDGPGGGCCGFFQPNQEYVNSFRTSGGLPLLDNSYNDDPVINDEGVPVSNDWDPATAYSRGTIVTVIDPSEPAYRQQKAYVSLIDSNTGNDPIDSPAAWALQWQEDPGPLDPRLDWSVGRRGIPYWDWGIHTGTDWIRAQYYAGPYSPKKQVYKKSQEGIYTDNGGWTKGFTANGYRMIRYADLLLLLAECQIETGDLEGACENINLIRRRAANPGGFVKEADGVTNSANYQVSEYPSFPGIVYARKTLRMERKLELGMEGHRWFDLIRWRTAVEEGNRVLTYEKSNAWGQWCYGSAAVGQEDTVFPIPQRQIDLSGGRLKQNR